MTRTYSTLERALFALFALLCFGAALLFAFFVATNVESRRNPAAWLVIIGGFALAAVSLKIVMTGTAWTYFEQKLPFRPPPPGQDA